MAADEWRMARDSPAPNTPLPRQDTERCACARPGNGDQHVEEGKKHASTDQLARHLTDLRARWSRRQWEEEEEEEQERPAEMETPHPSFPAVRRTVEQQGQVATAPETHAPSLPAFRRLVAFFFSMRGDVDQAEEEDDWERRDAENR